MLIAARADTVAYFGQWDIVVLNKGRRFY